MSLPWSYRAGRTLLQALSTLRATRPGPEELALPALVLAPHKDDETLGAGATILRKIQAGAAVKVLFFTDGRNSHPGRMAPEDLVERRTRETREAARVLGLGPEDLIFLELEDGRLEGQMEQAVQGAQAALEAFRPREVYLPYRFEPQEDHEAAWKASIQALRRSGGSYLVREYPVWFWFRWPWVPLPRPALRERPRRLGKALAGAWRFLRDFDTMVPTDGFLDNKRKALACYVTQTTRMEDDPRWVTLGDVGDGEFLRCFFGEAEVFHSYSLGTGWKDSRE